MSGHSKWHSIKHKKGAIDAKRGKLFTKIIREISISARLGGGDASCNPRLRTAVERGKAFNMPAENIKRAIQKGTGELEGTTYEELTLEGYGPGGAAVLVEGNSDNRNRTVSEIRHLFTKNGGNLGSVGCVAYMFRPRGYIAVSKEKINEDDLMGLVLDAGAEDIRASAGLWEIYTSPADFDRVLEAIKESGLEPELSHVGKFAENSVVLEAGKVQQMLKLIDGLEDNDDVQNVWSNFDIADKDLEAATAR